MISFTKDSNTAQTVRVIGVGNAGVHLADMVVMRGTRDVEVLAMNTDTTSLDASVVSRKIALGERVARGLGAGGDPEIGHEAALESSEEIRQAIEGATVIVLLGGLGGGTATGVLPVIAQHAQEKDIFVIALVTEPFEFEGRRRVTQAQYSKKALAAHCDITLSFENGRMAELSSPRESIEETFEVADAMLADCVASLAEMLSGRGPMPVDLLGISRAFSPGTLPFFGRGESSSKNRASEALERALRGPLAATHALQEATAVVVHVTGPESLSFLEMAAIMQEMGRHFPETVKFFMGVSTDTAESLRVTLLGTTSVSATSSIAKVTTQPRPTVPSTPPEPPPTPTPAVPVAPTIPKTPSIPRDGAPFPSTPSTPNPSRPKTKTSEPVPVRAPTLTPPAPLPEPTPAPSPQLRPPGRLLANADAPSADPELLTPTMLDEVIVDPKPKTKRDKTQSKSEQGVLQFDAVRSARFDKSAPTIIDGEDLDKPAFMRVKNS